MSQQNTQPIPDEASSVNHASFTVERTYPHPPERVFFAHADTAATRRWRVEGEGFEILEHVMDFRVGGAETARFRFGESPVIVCETQYQDIVPDRRIVFTYRMIMGSAPMSVSLATIELAPSGGGTRLRYTEQGAYFDDPTAVANREEGARQLLESLGAELDRAS